MSYTDTVRKARPPSSSLSSVAEIHQPTVVLGAGKAQFVRC
jgi:hypothetical protein